MNATSLFLRTRPALVVLFCTALGACTSSYNIDDRVQSENLSANEYGVLVMAHGGSAAWNSSVEDSLGQLRSRYPVELAFGMADAGSLEDSVRRLEAQGVGHVGVVRLFVSGESWYQRTSQIFGLEEGAPAKTAHSHDQAHTAMPMGFWKIDSNIGFHLSKEGLAEAEEMDQVLLSRAQALSENPQSEVLAIIAHGPADDAEDRRWIAEISKRTVLLQRELNLRDVRVFTLREDWEEKREGAEAEIRDYLQAAANRGLTPLVVPFRVQGFGPYAGVLSGLDYRADHQGLTPHANVARWIENQAEALRVEAQQHKLQLASSDNGED